MLPRKYRLTRPLRSREVNKISSPTLIVTSFKNTISYTRFIFIVSKKVDKRAVVRNKVKRVLSAQVEKIYDNLAHGLDISITARKEAAQIPKEILCKELINLLEKQNLLKQ